MRPRLLFWSCVPLLLAGCGGGDKPAVSLTVTCGGSVALAGARSVDVLGGPVNGQTVMSFPDPANPGHTGTLAVRPQDRCTITPSSDSGG